MSAVAERLPAPAPGPRTLAVLATLEVRRFARHPLFLAGTATCGLATASVANQPKSDALAGDAFFPALFVGLASMVVAYRLTRSPGSLEEALDALPTPATTRTTALCLACLLPAVVGAIWLAVMLSSVRWFPRQPWLHGTFGPSDRVAILAGECVLACLGAPLLGVAAGRWFRFPGGAVLLLIGVLGWVTAGLAVAVHSSGGLLPTAVRLSAPFTFFLTNGPGNRSVDSWTGSPGWYLLWLAALCGLASIAALLHGATGATRTGLLRLGAFCLAAGALTYGLAVTGGLSRVVTSYPDGTQTTGAPR